jgi:hypothetical protein
VAVAAFSATGEAALRAAGHSRHRRGEIFAMSSSSDRRARRAKRNRSEEPKKTAALSDNYHRMMGLFNGTWASLDLTTDYAIYRFLNVTPGQAHLITSGMMFGRKARLLADLIGHSDHPKRAEILGAFNKVRGGNMRDVFAHSYIRSGDDSVTFVDRSSSGEFKATEHTFTMLDLAKHVHDFAISVEAFWNALGVTKPEIEEFAMAAFSLNRKPKTLPAKPIAKS